MSCVIPFIKFIPSNATSTCRSGITLTSISPGTVTTEEADFVINGTGLSGATVPAVYIYDIPSGDLIATLTPIMISTTPTSISFRLVDIPIGSPKTGAILITQGGGVCPVAASFFINVP